jgi:hypothetical protein
VIFKAGKLNLMNEEMLTVYGFIFYLVIKAFLADSQAPPFYKTTV